MNDQRRSGFTLIEMLVVIAVVGILSATVLTALNPARGKAKDSRIVTGMQQLRAVAETMYNGTTGMYEGIAADAAKFTSQKNDFKNNGAVLATFKADMPSGARAYRIWIKLPNSGKVYCVDSAGNTKEQDAEPNASGATCNP